MPVLSSSCTLSRMFSRDAVEVVIDTGNSQLTVSMFRMLSKLAIAHLLQYILTPTCHPSPAAIYMLTPFCYPLPAATVCYHAPTATCMLPHTSCHLSSTAPSYMLPPPTATCTYPPPSTTWMLPPTCHPSPAATYVWIQFNKFYSKWNITTNIKIFLHLYMIKSDLLTFRLDLVMGGCHYNPILLSLTTNTCVLPPTSCRLPPTSCHQYATPIQLPPVCYLPHVCYPPPAATCRLLPPATSCILPHQLLLVCYLPLAVTCMLPPPAATCMLPPPAATC